MARVVSATGVSVGSTLTGNVETAARIEKAMKEAIEKATREGVTDPEEIKRRMLEARDNAQ